ncbi:N-acetyllactosamine synthase [Aureococcus anophagefferens]|nr:N-acetyllactosamine synthase [Aureococcus anophagefferens]
MRKRVKDVLVFGFGSILLFGAYNVIRQNQRVIEQHADRARALEARLGRALEAEIELLKAEAEAEAEAARFKAGADAAAATCEAERVADAAAAERERLRAEQLQKLAFDRLQAEAAAATRTARSLEAGAAAAKKKIAQLQKDDAKKTLAEAQALESRRRSHRRMTAPLRDAPHRLAIVVPFRDDGGADKLSQGIGRSRNLDEFGKYMCAFVDVPFDVVVVEQSPDGAFNKGSLFNVGYQLTKASHDYMVLQDVDQVHVRVRRRPFDVVVVEQSPDGAFNKGSLFNVGYQMTKASHDYMVLQDVDQVPERRENAYAWRDEPTLLLGATSQWQYKVSSNESHVVGGAFQISHAEYSDVGGYSNLFEGWGMEDHNMGWRVRKHMGYGKLDGNIGRYTALAHERVKGLDRTEAFGRNAENAERTCRAASTRSASRARRIRDALRRRVRRDRDGGALRVRARTRRRWIRSSRRRAHDRTDAKPGDAARTRSRRCGPTPGPGGDARGRSAASARRACDARSCGSIRVRRSRPTRPGPRSELVEVTVE